MVDEVTKRLSPADPMYSTPVASTIACQGINCPAPGSLTELPLAVPGALPTSAAPVPTAVTTFSVINSSGSRSHQLPGLPPGSSPGLADAIVQGSVTATQSALLDELPVTNPVLPAQLISSPSLPVDARVCEKLRSKIWNNEYIEFDALLANPIVESKYKVTISSSEKGPFPFLCLEPVNKARKIYPLKHG